MQRSLALPALALAAAFACSAAGAAETAAPQARHAAAKKAAKPATPREKLQSEAKGLALAIDTTEAINAAQLDIAGRVNTGRADCEFNQNVEVDAVPEHPGWFQVAFAKQRFMMVPEETTTGAVRLVDKKAGVIWLQIPVKSMLINTKAGQRMVDACLHAQQRAAVEAARAVVTPVTLQ